MLKQALKPYCWAVGLMAYALHGFSAADTQISGMLTAVEDPPVATTAADDGAAAAEALILRIIKQRAERELLTEQIAIARMQRELRQLQSPVPSSENPEEALAQTSSEPPTESAEMNLKVIGSWQREGQAIAAVAATDSPLLRHIRIGDVLPGLSARFVVSRIDATGVWAKHPETGDEIALPR